MSPEGLSFITILIIALLAALPGFLSLILFFKIWGMTNNVEKILSTLEEWLELEHPMIENDTNNTKLPKP